MYTKMRNAFNEINARKETVFANTKGPILLVDNEKKELPFLHGSKVEYSLVELADHSQVPSKGYAVKVGAYTFENKNESACEKDRAVLHLIPEGGSEADWKIAFISENSLILEHPVMGQLLYPWSLYFHLSVGQEIRLRQQVRSVGKQYLLTYEFCNS